MYFLSIKVLKIYIVALDVSPNFRFDFFQYLSNFKIFYDIYSRRNTLYLKMYLLFNIPHLRKTSYIFPDCNGCKMATILYRVSKAGVYRITICNAYDRDDYLLNQSSR